jgi:uncharacterized membrane protein HdeD (DUF308 family)
MDKEETMTIIDGTQLDVDALVRNWWAILLRGVLGITFGIVTVFWPGLSLAGVILVYGAYAFTDGVFALISAVRGRTEGSPQWATILRGLLGIGAGVATVLWPVLTALALLAVVAAWSIVGGLLEIVAAIRLRREIQGEWALILSGVLSIALGVVLVLLPGAGALALVLWVGAYALVIGVVQVVLSFRLRSWGRRELGHRVPPNLGPTLASHR